MKYNGLDIFDIVLRDGDYGIGATSLVTLPATESNFLHFGKDDVQFKFADEEKRELIGAIMIPDKPIFRKIGDHSFYVNFTQNVIRELTSKMLKTGTVGLFTIQHMAEVVGDDVEVQEVWVKETETDKSTAFGIDEPIGSSFMKVKINSEAIWKAIKEFGLTGFSIELDASIARKNEMFNKKPEIEIMKITDVFSNTINVNGVDLYFNSELAAKTYLVSADSEGKPTAYSGEFSHADVKYTVENGVVTEAINIQLSTDEAIKKLSDGFEAVTSRIDGLVTSEKAIEDKEAELELLKEQFEIEKADFAKLKEKGVDKVVTSFASSIASNQGEARNWFAKFSK